MAVICPNQVRANKKDQKRQMKTRRNAKWNYAKSPDGAMGIWHISW
jgi:hypothetical protein